MISNIRKLQGMITVMTIFAIIYGFSISKNKPAVYCVREISFEQDNNTDIRVGDFFTLPIEPEIADKFNHQLEPILLFLKKYPDLTIELAVHSDHLGGKYYNDSITKIQAMYAYEWLILNDIHPNRILPVGKGANYPFYVFKKLSLRNTPFHEVEFEQNSLLNQSYIDGVRDKTKKLAALYLNRRIVVTVINSSI